MNKFKIVGWITALLLLLVVGAAVGGGLVYAATRDSDSISFTFSSEGEELFEPEPGIVIAAVVPDGPAADAGIVRGDILLQVDDEAVNDVVELMRVLQAHEAGDEVDLMILHGDEERTLTATLPTMRCISTWSIRSWAFQIRKTRILHPRSRIP